MFFSCLAPGAAQRPAALWLALCLVLFLTGCGSKVIAPSGRTAQEVAPAKALNVTATARKQLGVPYRYGGNAPSGFDCSGLIWWAYRQHGLAVPRVTTDQAKAGRGVTLAQARPGDILVFKAGSGLHTGLYAGKGVFIHAPSSGKRVQEESVSNTYWRPRLKAVRRIIVNG